MAIVEAAQLLANIVSLGDPTDVENDGTAAPMGTINVQATPIAGNSGFITVELNNTLASLAALTPGPCTITITQGAGTLSVTTAQ